MATLALASPRPMVMRLPLVMVVMVVRVMVTEMAMMAVVAGRVSAPEWLAD